MLSTRSIRKVDLVLKMALEPVFTLNSDVPLHQLQPILKIYGLEISYSQQAAVLNCALDNGSLQYPSSGDFLEIDDLICTRESTYGIIENPAEKTSFEEVDGLLELDLFHDADMFLHDIGHADEKNLIFPETDFLNYGMVNESNYQVHQNSLPAADETSDQLFVHYRRGDAFTQAGSIQRVELHPSGTLMLMAENMTP
ncbi:hypothetical protein SAY86_023295 [Trapa natans]|uniref:Uncharacterized protein n=1 Tax=Trapa natans TaxID=22666 RepID=A0AAN7R980_TRANT|nr:hypothetical protein SAY86_023295 [Trapa natans]